MQLITTKSTMSTTMSTTPANTQNIDQSDAKAKVNEKQLEFNLLDRTIQQICSCLVVLSSWT